MKLFWAIYGFFYDFISYLTPYQKMIQDVITKVAPKEGDRILDLGCGTGNLEKSIKCDCSITGLDFSKIMLDIAKRKNRLGNNKFVLFDLNKINKFASNDEDKYNKIVISNVLYSIENPEIFIEVIVKLLSDDGLIVISNPDRGFSFIKIFFSHLYNIKCIFDFFVTCIIFPILLFVYLLNLMINGAERIKKYHVLDSEYIISQLRMRGLVIINVDKTYANQNTIFVAKKISRDIFSA